MGRLLPTSTRTLKQRKLISKKKWKEKTVFNFKAKKVSLKAGENARDKKETKR
jgi:hypothetical protein